MLETGSFKIDVPANSQLNCEGQSEFVIMELDENDKPIAMVARSNKRKLRFTSRRDSKLLFDIAPKQFISVDARPVPPVHEVVSDVPYEIPDNNLANLTLEEKLKHYLSEMVAERYGEDSAAYDTFEDSMDFDDDEPEPLSGYELKDMQPEEPIPHEELNTETPNPVPPGNPTGYGS